VEEERTSLEMANSWNLTSVGRMVLDPVRMETVWTAKDERGFPSKRRELAASGSASGAPTVKHRSVADL